MLPFSFAHYSKNPSIKVPYDKIRDLLRQHNFSKSPTLPAGEVKRLRTLLKSKDIAETWAKEMALETSRINGVPLTAVTPMNQLTAEAIEKLKAEKDRPDRVFYPLELELIKKAVLCGAEIEQLMTLSAWSPKVLELSPRYRAALDAIVTHADVQLEALAPEVAAYWFCFAYPEGVYAVENMENDVALSRYFTAQGAYITNFTDFDFLRAHNRVFGMYTSNKSKVAGTMMFLYSHRKTIAAAFYSPNAHKKIPKRGRPLKVKDTTAGASGLPRILASENYFYLTNTQSLEYRPNTAPQHWPMIFVAPHALASAVRVVKTLESCLGRRSDIPSEVLAARLLWRLRGVVPTPSNEVSQRLYATVKTNTAACVRFIPNLIHMLSFENVIHLNPGANSAEIVDKLGQLFNDITAWATIRQAT